jgi:hypothetical protein
MYDHASRKGRKFVSKFKPIDERSPNVLTEAGFHLM